MDYNTWKTFSYIDINDYETVRIYWDSIPGKATTIEVFVDAEDNLREDPFVFRTGDNSFGDFLYGEYLLTEEYFDNRVYEYTDINGAVKHDLTNASYLGCSLSVPITEYAASNCGISVMDCKADVSYVSSIEDTLEELKAKYAEASPMTNSYNNTTTNNKENNIMKFNFDFGPVNGSLVRMSMYGLAVKNKAGTWVSYDAASGNIVDVDVFNFDGAKFLYRMPVAIKDIAAGDIVIHNGAPMFVLGVPVGGKTLTVVDTINGERKDIMLATSPFGFNFATKVVNFLGNMMTGAATADTPFGNMWMLMAMSGDTKMEDMLPMALMAGGMDMSNPMMMWALMGNRTNDPMMLAMAMGAFNKPAAPAHTCTCGGNCGTAADGN